MHLHPNTAKLLPSSLTYLKIGTLCERVCAHLPAGLKTLESCRTLMSPNFFKSLPKSLTSLTLICNPPSSPWFDCNTGKRLDTISKHPEYFTHEICVSNCFDWKDSSCLSSSITSLIMIGFDQLGDTFMLNQQLPNLLELDLGNSKHLSDLSIPLLSAHLTVLDLWSSSRVSGKSFEILPRGLLSLHLNSSESIFDDDIQHLPRTLKRVEMNKAIHLTDLCISDLPPHLEHLELKSSTLITPSSFPHLPYSLRSYQHRIVGIFRSWYIGRGIIVKKF